MTIFRIISGIVVVAFALAAFADTANRQAARVAAPSFKIENAGTCVAPTAEMRRDHMKMLLHQRDLTVRQGLRDPRFSLKNCVECHASKTTGSVLGKDGFCASCHSFSSVSIDCFECHSAHRQGQPTAAAQ